MPLNTAVSPSRHQPPYLIESFVSKGSETVYFTISNYISFGAELHVGCSKAFWNIINAILPSSNDFYCVSQACIKVCSSRRQPPYHMKSFVSKGSETVYLTILNYISFEAEWHVDCSKALYNMIKRWPDFIIRRCSPTIKTPKYGSWCFATYRTFNVERIRVQAF